MEIIQYTLFSITTILGLFLGALISYLTPAEHLMLKRILSYLRIPHFDDEAIFGIAGLIFAGFSFGQYLFVYAAIVFLYALAYGSLLFITKEKRNLFKVAFAFVIAAVIGRLVTTFLF